MSTAIKIHVVMITIKIAIGFNLVLFCIADETFRRNAFTSSGKMCMKVCKKAIDGTDGLCQVGWDNSTTEYCNNETSIAFVYFASLNIQQEVKKCTSECVRTNEGYFWCFTGDDTWDYCSPRAGVSAYENKCVDACSKYDDDYHYTCRVGKSMSGKTREICSKSPYVPGYWYLNDEFKNLIDSQESNSSNSDQQTDLPSLQNLLKQYELHFGGNLLQENNKALIYYTSIIDDGVIVVLTMSSTLSPAMTLFNNSKIPEVLSDFDNRMTDLNSQSEDEKAYILGPILGGPTLNSVNIIPRNQDLKSGLWGKVEEKLEKKLFSGEVATVVWSIILGYEGDENMPSSRRPFALGLHYTIHYNDGKKKESEDHFFLNKQQRIHEGN